MMSTTTEWQVCLMDTITLAHRRWYQRGGTGEGRIVLEERNLTRAILSGINFTKALFSRCDWSNSDISGRFPEAEIIECIWNNSLLCVDFDRALIKNCNFTDSYLGTADFIGTKIQGGDWTRCDLDKSTWTDAVIENACFERVNLWRSKLHGSHFKGCDFREGNLMSVKADNAIFENCDFRGAYLRSFRFNNTKFINCGFHGCIGNPKFAGDCILIEPDLSPAFDGTEIAEPEQILSLWQSGRNKSIEVTISSNTHPQWLNYISKEHEDLQVDWVVDEKMKGSRPMDVKGKDLSRASAYQAYFAAARFTECNFTASDMRRTKVQQAEFVSCKFDNALLMYLDGANKESLDVETSKVIFKNCTAKGAYFNRSELWVGEFNGGNWDGSFFNNCMWTLVEFENVSFENTDWRGAKLDGVKFVNCNFKNALFEKAKFIATKFYDCDFRGADFGRSTGGAIIKIERCAFAGAKGIWFDTGGRPDISGVVDADLSINFDGTLVYKFAETVQDFFFDIRALNSEENETNESSQLATNDAQNELTSATSEESVLEVTPNINSPAEESETKIENAPKTDLSASTSSNNKKSTAKPKSPANRELETNKPKKQHKSKSAKSTPEALSKPGIESKNTEQKQESVSVQEKLIELKSKLKKAEERIAHARKTNIFGRPQSGVDEKERDKLIQEIEEIENRIAGNE